MKGGGLQARRLQRSSLNPGGPARRSQKASGWGRPLRILCGRQIVASSSFPSFCRSIEMFQELGRRSCRHGKTESSWEPEVVDDCSSRCCMVNNHMQSVQSWLLLGSLVLGTTPLSAGGQNPVYSAHHKAQSAAVSVMALGSSVHHGFAGNRDVYLARIQIKGQDAQIAKLVDSYPSSDAPIRRSILIERRSLRMMLLRDEECDSPGKQFFLGNDESNIFDTASRDALKQASGENLTCFQIVHEATRLPKSHTSTTF